MKKVVLAAAAMFFAVGVFAQGQPGFGLKAGVNFPKYNFSGENSSTETKSTTNFHVTAFVDFPIAANFSFQPGISLQGKGAELYSSSVGTLTQNTMYVEIPANLAVKFPIQNAGNLFIGAGPYVGFGISGKNNYDSDWLSVEQEFEFGKDNTLKSTDFGVNFIGGFHLANGFMIHGGYGLGLTDIRGSNNSSFSESGKLTNRVWSAGIGFLF